MSRRFLVLLSLLLLAALIASCAPVPTQSTGGATAPTTAPSSAATTAPADQGAAATTAPASGQGDQAPVTLTWGFWGSPEEKASHEKVAAEYTKLHPNVKFEYFFAPWDEYFTKVKTLWAGGDPKAIPDVLFLWPTPSYAATGVLENLQPYIEKSGYDLKDYWPYLLDSARYNGAVYGLPRDIDAKVLYYNKNLFDAAGVAYPTDKWTWDDLLAAAQKLTKKDGDRVTQYALGAGADMWPIFVGQAGGMVLDDLTNPSKCTLDTPEAIKGLKFFTDLMNNGYAMRAAALNQQGGDQAVFETGQVAMIIQNSSRVPAFNANANLNYDVAPVPLMPGGQRWNFNGGAAWVMSAKSDNKDAAWEFMKWLQGKGGGESIYTRNGEIFPALRSVANSDDFLAPAKPANRKAFVTEAEAAKPGGFGYFPQWDELSGSILTPQLDRLWAGEGTPDQVVPELCKAVNQFLVTNGYPKK
jgi:multiple sugar transport system substrate-binding protein